MVEKSVQVNLVDGFMDQMAAKFVQEANRYSADLFIEKNGQKVNAKSIMGIMSLAIARGDRITLIADGVDDNIAISHLITLFTNESS